MRNYTAKTVDEYISNSPEVAQKTLIAVRRAIKSATPEAEEKISWGIPFYKYYGYLTGFSAFTKHVSFGFTDTLPIEYRKLFEQNGYKTGSRTVQIRFDQEVPSKLIEQMVKAKAQTNRTSKTTIQ